MSWLRFFFYVLRHGSLFNKPVNFKDRQEDVLETLVFLKPYDYRSFYNIETANRVFNMYRKDVEKFGYEEEYRSLLLYLKE